MLTINSAPINVSLSVPFAGFKVRPVRIHHVGNNATAHYIMHFITRRDAAFLRLRYYWSKPGDASQPCVKKCSIWYYTIDLLTVWDIWRPVTMTMVIIANKRKVDSGSLGSHFNITFRLSSRMEILVILLSSFSNNKDHNVILLLIYVATVSTEWVTTPPLIGSWLLTHFPNTFLA